MVRCFHVALSEGMPAQILFQLSDGILVRRAQSFREAVEQARNAEEALLALLNATILPAIFERNFTPVDIRPPSRDKLTMGAMIRRIRGQRHGPSNMSLRLLTGLAMDDEVLEFQDFYGADFRKCKLTNCSLVGVNMTRADLSGADLTDSKLLYSSFVETILDETTASGAAIEDADFLGAKLRRADFRSARFRRVRMVGAEITDCDFKGAQFERTSLPRSQRRRRDQEELVAIEAIKEGGDA